MTKLIEEINTMKYENYNVLVKLDIKPSELHFMKTIKHFSFVGIYKLDETYAKLKIRDHFENDNLPKFDLYNLTSL